MLNDEICHNTFISYSPKFTLFSWKKIIKKVIITKRPAMWQKLAEEDLRYIQKNEAEILDKIWSIIIPRCTKD
jgi:hypothetical protein